MWLKRKEGRSEKKKPRAHDNSSARQTGLGALDSPGCPINHADHERLDCIKLPPVSAVVKDEKYESPARRRLMNIPPAVSSNKRKASTSSKTAKRVKMSVTSSVRIIPDQELDEDELPDMAHIYSTAVPAVTSRPRKRTVRLFVSQKLDTTSHIISDNDDAPDEVEADKWIAELDLLFNDRAILLMAPNNCLTGRHMHAASILLKQQFGPKLGGFQDVHLVPQEVIKGMNNKSVMVRTIDRNAYETVN